VTTTLSLGLKLDNCPRGYLGPGGLSDNGLYSHCTGGMHRAIDVLVFGDKHIYDNPTFKDVYQSYDHFDPEGLLGSFSACTLCYLGLICGRIFIFYKSNKRMQLKVLSTISISLITIGLIITRFSKNEGYINYNKNLWTLPFIIINAGYSIILFNICYILIDYYNLLNGQPLEAVGKHALIIYIISELSIFCNYFSSGSSHDEVVLSNIMGVVFFIVLANVLAYLHVYRIIKI
jgi:heparan-alpha-glucosaminide N-acetyltransferase